MTPSTRAKRASLPKHRDSIGEDRILDAVEALLAGPGYAALSMRRIAAHAQVSLGTASYFGSREALVARVVERIVASYKRVIEQLAEATSGDPRGLFVEAVDFLVEDVSSPRTSALFPELWAMALHDGATAAAMSELYAAERSGLSLLLSAGWPDLGAAQVESIVGGLVPLIEGLTVFARGIEPLYPRQDASKLVHQWLEAMLTAFGRG